MLVCGVRAGHRPSTEKGNDGLVLSHAPTAWADCSASPNPTRRKATCTLLSGPVGNTLFLGRRPRPLLQDVGATGWDVFAGFPTFTFYNRQTVVVFGIASRFLCCQFNSYHLLWHQLPKYPSGRTPIHLSCTRLFVHVR